MPRYFLELAYKGTAFHGWQTQNNAVTVQQELDKALSILCRTKIESLGCGRTDAGVHASQFFAHFDAEIPDEIFEKFVHRINAILHESIVVYKIFNVNDNAHARFDATLRSYSYYLCKTKTPFLKELAWQFYADVDMNKMNEGAALLLKYNDYGCFSKSGGQQHTFLCNISEAIWMEEGEMLRFKISANRFLRGMVRAIVGTLIELGQDKIDLKTFESILQSGDRTQAGQSVPAQGLYLEEIIYPYLKNTASFAI